MDNEPSSSRQSVPADSEAATSRGRMNTNLAESDPSWHDESEDAPSMVYFAARTPLANPETTLLAHPLVWLSISILVFAVAWLFPPKLYTSMLGDDNHLFLDMQVLAFNTASLIMLILGFWIGVGGRPLETRIQRAIESPLAGAPATTYGILILFILMNFAALGLFVQSGGLGAIMRSLSGASLNRELTLVAENSRYGSMWISLLLLPSMCFGVTYHIYRASPRDNWVRILFYILVATFFVAAFLSSKRNFLARPLFAILLSYLVWPTHRGLRLRHAVTICATTGFVMLSVFIGIAVLRNGVAGTSDGIREVSRYLLGGYNTEALIVNEQFILPGSNKGYFWTAWIWEFPVVEWFVDLQGIRAEFFGEKVPVGAVERGSLMREYGLSINTAIPAFACSYVDFGWAGIFPFFLMGFAVAVCWKQFAAGSLGGLIFYPMAAYALVEMRSKIHFPGPSFGAGIILFLLISVPMFVERPRGRKRSFSVQTRSM